MIAIAVAAASRGARADEDPVTAARRERFRSGMEKYAAGSYGDAIVVWEAIYRELGEAAGYKLAFNLGRAYDKFGDSTRAAERYEVFVRRVEQERVSGEPPAPEIEHWESEAKERLAELAKTKGRIRIAAGERPTAVRIDSGEPRIGAFVAYVAPGRHTVTFGAGKDAPRAEIEVAEGAIVDLSPPPPAPPAAPEEPAQPAAVVAAPAPRAAPRYDTRTVRPFSPVVLYAGAGATLAAIVVPALGYASALAIKEDYDAANERGDAHAAGVASEYESARGAAYATLAIPIALGVVTAGLATWFFVGTKETRVTIGAGSISGRF